MSAPWITLLAFASVSLLAISLGMLIYDCAFRYRFQVRDRLRGLSMEDGCEGVSLFKDININRLPVQDIEKNQNWSEWLQQLIDQSGVEWSRTSLAAFCLGSGIGAALLGFLGVWWLGIALMPLGACLPFGMLYARRQGRQRKLSRQLPEAFQMISRAVSAGQTVPSALQIIAQEFDPPISEEFALCYEQQNLGMSRESALRKLARRTGIMELQIFVVAMLIQAKSGGDLVELLDSLATMIRKRLKLKDRIRALTGEGRMQAVVLIVLPIMAFLGVMLLAPDYAQSLLERPWLLAATAAMQALGALWIRQIISFDY